MIIICTYEIIHIFCFVLKSSPLISRCLSERPCLHSPSLIADQRAYFPILCMLTPWKISAVSQDVFDPRHQLKPHGWGLFRKWMIRALLRFWIWTKVPTIRSNVFLGEFNEADSLGQNQVTWDQMGLINFWTMCILIFTTEALGSSLVPRAPDSSSCSFWWHLIFKVHIIALELLSTSCAMFSYIFCSRYRNVGTAQVALEYPSPPVKPPTPRSDPEWIRSSSHWQWSKKNRARAVQSPRCSALGFWLTDGFLWTFAVVRTSMSHQLGENLELHANIIKTKMVLWTNIHHLNWENLQCLVIQPAPPILDHHSIV